jgi:hypothetical protein
VTLITQTLMMQAETVSEMLDTNKADHPRRPHCMKVVLMQNLAQIFVPHLLLK